MFLQEQYRTDQPAWKCKLTFKILIKTADDFFCGGGHLSEKIRLGISCELYDWQTTHRKC